MHKEFESKRLFFRFLKESDVSEQYANWLNDSEVNQYLETRFEFQNQQKILKFVETQNLDPNVFLWGLFSKKTGSHIGNIKLGPINTYHECADISLFVGDKGCWGKGFATEAILSVTCHGFEKLGLKKIEAGCYESNIGSLNAFLKVGFKVEGIIRDHVRCGQKRMGVYRLGILSSELK